MSLQKRRWAARAFALASRIAEALAGLPNRLTPAPFRLMQIGSGFWHSRALHVAASLDLATVIGDKSWSMDDLARLTKTDPDALYRLTRMLSAIGVFKLRSDRTISNNALSGALRSDRPGTVRSMVLMHNSPEMSHPWFMHLERGIRTGVPPFECTHGKALFDYMSDHPAFDALFAKAMDEVEALGDESFATSFDWTAFDRLFDIGGSKGSKALTILRHHKHLHACVIDRLQVIRQAQALAPADSTGARARLSFRSGDALGELPAASGPRDAYLLAAVLHGFDDADCTRILGNLVHAISRSGASIVVMEVIVPEDRPELTSSSFDMQMFMGTRGRERTHTQWAQLFERSGLNWADTVHLSSFAKMMVLRPA